MTCLVFPMLGHGSRFVKANYRVPKYLLPLCGRPLLYWTLYSFRKCLDWKLIFVVRRDHLVFSSDSLIKSLCEEIGFTSYEIILFDGNSTGQAHTFDIALNGIDDDVSVSCFNIDSIHLNFDYSYYDNSPYCSIESFKGSGDHWSFLKVSSEDPLRVISTAEKMRISDNCSNGFYYFSRKSYFSSYFKNLKASGPNSEHYICPLYNLLVSDGIYVANKSVRFSDLLFSGTPREYELLLSTFSSPEQLYSRFS